MAGTWVAVNTLHGNPPNYTQGIFYSHNTRFCLVQYLLLELLIIFKCLKDCCFLPQLRWFTTTNIKFLASTRGTASIIPWSQDFHWSQVPGGRSACWCLSITQHLYSCLKTTKSFHCFFFFSSFATVPSDLDLPIKFRALQFLRPKLEIPHFAPSLSPPDSRYITPKFCLQPAGSTKTIKSKSGNRSHNLLGFQVFHNIWIFPEAALFHA